MVIVLLLSCVFYSDSDRDRDGDGERSVAFGGLDCDDADAQVHPGALESCNGADDDCDGAVDVGAADGTAGYVDGDGDGWGGEEVLVCAGASGVVSEPGDCDDADATSHPGAVDDVCTGTDEDCDGSPGPAGAKADIRLGGEAGGVSGLGRALATGIQDGPGAVLVAGSADAGQVLVFSLAEGAEQTSADRWARIEGGGDSVAFGDAFVSDFDADDVFVGDAAADEGRGRLGIFQLAETGGDHSWDQASVMWTGAMPGDGLGSTVAFFEGGEGYSSVMLVGAPGADEGRGRVYIVQLNAGGDSGTREIIDSNYGFVSSPFLTLGAGMGSALAGWGDTDGRLYGVYAAPLESGRFGPETGIFTMAQIGTIDVYQSAVPRYVGASSGDRFGTVLLGADFDEDGVGDLLVSAPGRDSDAGADVGAVYVLPGSIVTLNSGKSGDIELTAASLVIEGDAAAGGLGRALAIEGGELVISGSYGDCGAGEPGEVYAVELGGTGSRVLAAEDRLFVGESAAEAGAALLFDNDGLWVGEPGFSRVERVQAP